MKRIITLLLLVVTTLAVSAQKQSEPKSFGEKITADNAMEASKLPELLKGKENVQAKITGTVNEVCQKKGCWAKMDVGNGETMMIRFKDYGFFLPKDCAGKKLVLNGVATYEVTTVEELRHYAQDAGRSKEEIEKITEEEKSLSFEADGVLLYE